MDRPTNRSASVFAYEGIPPAGQLIPLGLQHVVAAVVGVITPSLIISGSEVCNLSADEKTTLIQASLVITALATLLQLFPAFRRIGSRLPVVMGISFAYVPALTAIGGQSGLPAILGAELAGGLIAVIFGIFVKPIRKLFPPLVTGTVIFTIGLSLYPTAVRYMAGGDASSEWFGGARSWGGGAVHLCRGHLPQQLRQGDLEAGFPALRYDRGVCCRLLRGDRGSVRRGGRPVGVPAPVHAL